MAARIFAPAEARLIEIWDYTLDKWGEKQADSYVCALVEGINSLADQRHRWLPIRDKVLRGVWFVRHEHHYVFFRELSGGNIGVITILHENMDIPARLKEDRKLAGET
jgi:plasmid stabilization system protein ParE